MRCVACDCELKDHETRRKALFTKEYIDLCDPCYMEIAEDVPLSVGDREVDLELESEYRHDHEQHDND